MILYHTATLEVQQPDTLHSRKRLDFGKGFYLTAMREQSERYGERFMRRGEQAIMNIYELMRTGRHSHTNSLKHTMATGSTLWQHAVKASLTRIMMSLMAVLPMTTCSTLLTSIWPESILGSKLLTSCGTSSLIIRFASPRRMC